MRKAKDPKKPAKITVGGQAVLDGVMMQAPDRIAIAVRRGDGKVALRSRPIRKLSDKYPFLGWPVIRGVANFAQMLVSGVKTLSESADMAGFQAEEPSALEKKAAKLLRRKPEDVMMAFAVILAVILAVGLFFMLPTGIESLVKRKIENRYALNAIGAAIRLTLFLAYVYFVSKLKDIKRVFRYHGAEHKSVFCFEAGLPLTVENARGFSSLHPRCGTSFLVIVMVISFFVFALLGTNSANVFLRVGSRLLLLPLVAGISYEALKWLGRARENRLVRALKWPGLMAQKLTTAEPDDSMIEVALIALKAALGLPDPLPRALDPDAPPDGPEAAEADPVGEARD